MKKLVFVTMLIMSISPILAQVYQQASAPLIKIEGTSTFHDWHMDSEQGRSVAVFNFNGITLTNVPSLTFTVRAETLKSGTKALNKNAYKALNTDKYPDITYTSKSVTVRANGANSYILNTKGALTIAGVTKEVSIPVTCTVNPADMTVQAGGSYKLKMSEFNVSAPSFMFGAMKTGNEITIKFNVSLKK
jgi:polyisoprenoid-binding protein YceI